MTDAQVLWRNAETMPSGPERDDLELLALSLEGREVVYHFEQEHEWLLRQKPMLARLIAQGYVLSLRDPDRSPQDVPRYFLRTT